MFTTVATQYTDVHVGDDWDGIPLEKQFGPFSYIQIQNEGPYPIKCLLTPLSANDFVIGVGEGVSINDNDAQIHHIKYKISNRLAVDGPINVAGHTTTKYSIMNIIGSYRRKLDKYRSITAPFEPSINQ